MKQSDLVEFEIEEEGFKLRICRESQKSPQSLGLNTIPVPQAAPLFSQTPATTPSSSTPPTASPASSTDIAFIKSPMVGTFYRSPSPDSKPFVEIGSEVTPTTPTCIIEAMKVMNEIQADITGTVIEALVESGHTVEYGQPLFKIKLKS